MPIDVYSDLDALVPHLIFEIGQRLPVLNK
jgi:hypothetical protein